MARESRKIFTGDTVISSTTRSKRGIRETKTLVTKPLLRNEKSTGFVTKNDKII